MEGLLTFLIFGAFFYFMMRFGCGAHMVHGHGSHGRRAADSMIESLDPVCGMRVTDNVGYAKSHDGKVYRFCSRKCLDAFEAAPDQYLTKKGVSS